MYLFFDTETSGLPRSWKAPITDLNNWPRLVQLAYLLYDNEGNQISSGNHIVKPEGFTIPESASRVHGITQSFASNGGEPLIEVLNQFNLVAKKAHYLVAHNISFDENVLGAEFIRTGIKTSIWNKQKICTKERTTDFCAIPGPYGNKWPTLSELYYKLFNSEFKDAHNAMTDTIITSKCFWELKKLNVL